MMAYSSIVHGSPKERESQLQMILSSLAGEDIPLDDALSRWAQWWNIRRKDFLISPRAVSLSPAGLR
jgi:hypothetical protein